MTEPVLLKFGAYWVFSLKIIKSTLEHVLVSLFWVILHHFNATAILFLYFFKWSTLQNHTKRSSSKETARHSVEN